MVVTARRLLFLGMFLLPMLRFHISGALNLSDAMFGLGAGVLALSKRPPDRPPKSAGWHFGAWIVAITGVIASYDAYHTFGTIQVVLNGVFVFFVWQWECRTLLDTPERLQRAMAAFIMGTGTSAFVAFLQTYFHVLGHATGYGAESLRAVGLGNQPNIAAIAYALAVILATGLVLEYGVRERWYLAGALLMTVAALIFTASVSGMATVLVGLTFLVIRRGVPIKNIIQVGVVLAIVYAGAVVLQGNKTSHSLNPIARIQLTTGNNTGYNTVGPREKTLENAWGKIETRPLVGHGLDPASLVTYFDPYVAGGTYYPPHDFFILVWYGGGIFMVFGMLIILASAFTRLLGPGRNPTRDIVFAGCITVLFFAMQSPELFDRWFWLPFVLAMCFRNNQGSQRRRGVVLRRAAAPLESSAT
jgi:O-antigen ligase